MVATEQDRVVSDVTGETLLKQTDQQILDQNHHWCSETDSLLPKRHGGQKGSDDIGYQKYGRLDTEVTCWNWLIGPIVFATLFGMVSSAYILTEYTKHYFKVREYEKANLSLDSNYSETRCSEDSDDIYYQAETRATSEASKLNSYFSLAGGIPSIIANLVLGAYTDAFGRKFLMVVGILGASIRLIISAVIIYLDEDLNYVIIACFIEGCTGQHATVLQMALAYTADITEAGRNRIYGIIYIEFALGVGLALASFVTGYVVDSLGYEVSMIIAAGILAANLLFVLVALPETLSKKHRKKDKKLISILKDCFKFFVLKDSLNKRWKFRIIIVIHILCNLSYVSRLNTETLYQLAAPFCWSPTKVGIYAAIRTLAIMFLGLGSVKVLQKFMDEVSICILGTISYGACFYWTAFASTDVTLYLIIAVGMFGALSVTMHRSILSHLTPPESQGAIFTAVGTIEVTTFMVANVSTSAIYSATVAYMRGFVFLVLGSYDALSLALLIVLKLGWYLEKRRLIGRDVKDTEIVVGNGTFRETNNQHANGYQTSSVVE